MMSAKKPLRLIHVFMNNNISSYRGVYSILLSWWNRTYRRSNPYVPVELLRNRIIIGFLERLFHHKNTERHTANTIVSWPNPKQWVIVHTSDLMMIIRQSIYILSIITREMGKLKTYSPTYCIMDNGENMLNVTHTLYKIYLTGIL